ncbi:MAG: transglycosylase SLT domain-containing protein [Dongiaceae bacterium]
MLSLAISAAVGWASASWALPPSFSPDYDLLIARAVLRYWPDYPRPFAYKAQLYQESRLDPAARSPVGAQGIAQFMPATWREVMPQLRMGRASAYDVGPAIYGGAFYMAQQRRFPDWRDWPEPERHRMAQAAYNAGAGNIRRALRLCAASEATTRWARVALCLPDVTGAHAAETITYVARIAQWQRLMEGRGLMTGEGE